MAKNKSALDEAGNDELVALIEGAAQEADKVWETFSQIDQDLLKACDSGSARDVATLLKAGANANANAAHGTALTISIRSEVDCIEKVKLLIAAKADVELPEPPDVAPLVVAISNNKPELVPLLLSAGAAIDRRDSPQGWTALMTAACMGTIETAAVLLKHGADLTLKSEHGLTAIDLARANGQEQILRLFLRHMEEASKRAG